MNSKKSRKSRKRVLDPHQYRVMQMHKSGDSLHEIQKKLALLGVLVKSRTTIKNFIASKKSLAVESEDWLGV